MNAADTIGRTLARLGHLAERPAVDLENSREQIARLLVGADRPLLVEELAESTGLHVNTVRTHLDVLRASGRADRIREPAGGRGRPKWLYVANTPDDRYQRLAQQLRHELDAADSPAIASEAARRWRQAEPASGRQAATPDEAVTVAAEALSGLGFEVAVSPVGDAVFLGQCPYAELVAEHPVICEIHARALEQVLDETGQEVRLRSMDVFPRPGVCVAHLSRPDTDPAWSVAGSRPSAGEAKKTKKPSKRRKA